MKKLFLHLSLFSFILIGACSDDKNDLTPDDADDNFITSVKFTVNNNEYTAVITDNDVTITVPYTVSLNNAVVNFEYTTSATIMPDPATIKDWDNERRFRVTSYNGKANEYTYHVVKDDIREEGDVTLKSESDINTFADKGITIINGNLTIGSDEKNAEIINNIAKLSKLKEIKGNLIFKNSYKASGLIGLENITAIGGLTVGTEENISSAFDIEALITLPRLTTITGNIVIFDNNVEWVQFDNVETIGGNIQICSSAITSVSLPKLKSVKGDFQVQGTTEKRESGGALTEITMPLLETVDGNIEIMNLALLNKIQFDKLTSAGGILLPTIPYDFETIALPELKTVGGDIHFLSNTNSTSVGGPTINTGIREIPMNKLETVGGTFRIYHLAELTKLPGLSNLKTAGGIDLFYLRKIPSDLNLSHITFTGGTIKIGNTGIQKLTASETINASLHIYETNVELVGIKNIKSLNLIQKRTGNYTIPFAIIDGNASIQLGEMDDLTFPNLIQVNGYLAIDETFTSPLAMYFPLLKKVAGQLHLPAAFDGIIELPVLEEIGIPENMSYFEVNKTHSLRIDMAKIPEMSFPKLKKIYGNGIHFDVGAKHDDTKLEGINMPELESVEGYFTIQGGSYDINNPGNRANITFTNLNIPKLTTVGSVDIMRCMGLTDFSMFRNIIKGITANKWSIKYCGYNPTYQNMVDGKYTAQ